MYGDCKKGVQSCSARAVLHSVSGWTANICLRLGNQPCLRWEERRVNEYEIRRRWWIGEAGRSFFPSVSPSKSQMSATVALTSTAITGTKPKTETRSTVAERAKDKFLETSLSCWVGHPWSHFRGYNLLTPPSSKE